METRLSRGLWLVYLGGPISGLSYEGATDWRDDVIAALPPQIVGVSPMRAKSYLSNSIAIADACPAHTLSSERGITARDRYDVMRSDMVAMNFLDADKASIGSSIEVGWADAYRKPLVVAMRPGDVHDHAMIRAIAGFIVPTLDDLVEVVTSVLLPAIPKEFAV